MSSDRLTELQSQLDSFVFMCFTCIGVLQRDAPPSPLESQIKDRLQNNNNTINPSPTTDNNNNNNTNINPTDNNIGNTFPLLYDDDPVFSKEVIAAREVAHSQAKDMATQVARIVKSINVLIDSLPGIDSTYNQQIDILQDLEEKNKQQVRYFR